MSSKQTRPLWPIELPWAERPLPVELDGQRCVDELLSEAGVETTEQLQEAYLRPVLPYPWPSFPDQS